MYSQHSKLNNYGASSNWKWKKKKAAKNDLSSIANQAVHYASAKLKVFV